MNANEQICLLDNLQSLLENQIEMFRKSNFAGVEVLAAKADLIVSEIVKTKMFEQSEFDGRRKHLIKLYKTLDLMMAAGKDSVEKQLQQVANGKKTLRKYRSNA